MKGRKVSVFVERADKEPRKSWSTPRLNYEMKLTFTLESLFIATIAVSAVLGALHANSTSVSSDIALVRVAITGVAVSLLPIAAVLAGHAFYVQPQLTVRLVGWSLAPFFGWLVFALFIW